jgi:hypothetical protein
MSTRLRDVPGGSRQEKTRFDPRDPRSGRSFPTVGKPPGGTEREHGVLSPLILSAADILIESQVPVKRFLPILALPPDFLGFWGI